MKAVLFTLLFFFLFLTGYSQDPQFINTNQSLVYLNPSFAGSNGYFRNQLSYRNQWPNLSGQFVTYANTFDFYVDAMKGGFAITSITDDQSHGTLKTSSFNFIYAQHLNLRKLKIIPSLQAGYVMKTLDKTKLNYGDMIDFRTKEVWENIGIIPKNSIHYIDLSSGLLINYNSFFAGASVLHMNEPLVGLSKEIKLPIRTNFHASYNFINWPRSIFNFSILGIKQQDFYLLRLQLQSLLFKHLILGAGYDNNYGISFLAGYKHNYFSAQLGYDFGTSKFSGNNSAGSYELHLSFNLRKKSERDSIVTFEKW